MIKTILEFNLIKDSVYFFNSLKEHQLEFSILSSLYLLLLIYLTNDVPFSYDEITTLYYFVHGSLKGIYISMTFYPFPNNHMLYSLFSNVAKIIFGNSEFTLRITSILSSLFSLLILSHLLIRAFDKKLGFALSILFCSLNGIFYYSFLARGYSLVILFFLIGILSVYNYSITNKRSFLTYLSISCTLGLYTMPSYLYPAISLYIFIFTHSMGKLNTKKLRQYLSSGLKTALFTAILYLPIVWRMGIQPITNNRFVQPISRNVVLENLMLHFTKTFDFLTFSHGNYLIFSLLLLSFLFRLKNNIQLNFLRVLSLFTIILSPILILLHSVVPFERTWIYLSVPIIILIGITLFQLNQFIPKFNIPLMTLGISIFFLTYNIGNRKIIFKEFYSGKEIAKVLFEMKVSNAVCTNDILTRTIGYYYRQLGEVSFKYTEANSALGKEHIYDAIITQTNLDPESIYKSESKIGEFNIYVYKKPKP